MPNQDSIIKVEGIEMFGSTGKVLTPPVSPTGAIQQHQIIRTFEDFVTFEVSAWVPGADAVTASLYPIFYVATVRCFLLEAKLRHDVNSSSGTVDVEKIVNGTAKGSGVSMIESTFSTASGARTTIRKKPTGTLANAQLSPGDAVALKAGGTLTSLSDVAVTCLFGISMRDLPTSFGV
mgnify:CR=1 FL=1